MIGPTADTDEEYLVSRKKNVCNLVSLKCFSVLLLVIIQLATERQVNMSRNEGIEVEASD